MCELQLKGQSMKAHNLTVILSLTLAIGLIFGCLVVVEELGPLRGTMTITTIYGDGTVETRIVEVYQSGGGYVTTRWPCNMYNWRCR